MTCFAVLFLCFFAQSYNNNKTARAPFFISRLMDELDELDELKDDSQKAIAVVR